MIKKWKTISSRIIGDFKIFSLIEKKCISPRNQKEFPFLVLKANDWINIIPVTGDGKVILVKQYRHGKDEITLEIPGGMVDDSDVSANEAAKRELLEETGYSSDEVIKLGKCSPNPAIFNNQLHIFLALNTKCVGKQNMEGTEDIEVLEVPIREVYEYIKTGQINHALVVAAFYMFKDSKYSELVL